MTTQSVAKTDGALVDLVSFTPAELDIITDALRIANEYYRTLQAQMRRQATFLDAWNPGGTTAAVFEEQFDRQATDAGELQLKIEAAR